MNQIYKPGDSVVEHSKRAALPAKVFYIRCAWVGLSIVPLVPIVIVFFIWMATKTNWSFNELLLGLLSIEEMSLFPMMCGLAIIMVYISILSGLIYRMVRHRRVL